MTLHGSRRTARAPSPAAWCSSGRHARWQYAAVNWREFVVELIGALAFPAAVVIIALIYKRQLKALLGERLKRLKAGPFEAEWEKAEAAIPQLPKPPKPPKGGPPSDEEVLKKTAEVSPRAAILERYVSFEQRLMHRLMRAGLRPATRGHPLTDMVRQAEKTGLIAPSTSSAIAGVQVLRNLAAHGPPDEVTDEKANEFLALAEAAEYALHNDVDRAIGNRRRLP